VIFVVFDFFSLDPICPQLVSASMHSSNAYDSHRATVGDTVTLELVTSERLFNANCDGSVGGCSVIIGEQYTATLESVSADGTHYVYAVILNAVGDSVARNLTYSVTDMRDLSGNVQTPSQWSVLTDASMQVSYGMQFLLILGRVGLCGAHV
jgi:hypothetical protein